MSTFIKELRNIMSKFIDDIEVAIRSIHLTQGVDDATLSKRISDTIAAGVAPLEAQLNEQGTQIAELQKALQDTVTALNSGDTATAQATATAAVNAAAGSNGSGVAGSNAS